METPNRVIFSLNGRVLSVYDDLGAALGGRPFLLGAEESAVFLAAADFGGLPRLLGAEDLAVFFAAFDLAGRPRLLGAAIDSLPAALSWRFREADRLSISSIWATISAITASSFLPGFL